MGKVQRTRYVERRARMDLTKSSEARAIVDAEVERVVAPYVNVLAPAKLQEMRAFVRDNLLLHPAISRVLEQLVTPAQVAESEEREIATGERRAEKEQEGKGGAKRG